MKKIVSILTVLIMLVCTLSVMVSAEVPTQPAFPDNGGWVSHLDGTLGLDGVYTLSMGSTGLSTVTSGDKTLFKVERLLNEGEVNLFFVPDKFTNATDMQYFEFFIDITECDLAEDQEYLGLLMRVNDAYNEDKGNVFMTGCPALILQNGEWTEVEFNEEGRLPIPKGFSGYVRVDWPTFSTTVNSYQGSTGDLDVSKVNQIIMWFYDSFTAGNSVYLNDFRFVNEGTGGTEIIPPTPTTEETTTPKETTTAEDTTTAADTTTAGTTTAAGTTAAPADTTAAPADDNGGNTGLIIGIVAAAVVIVAVVVVIVVKKKKK